MAFTAVEEKPEKEVKTAKKYDKRVILGIIYLSIQKFQIFEPFAQQSNNFQTT